MIEIKKCPLCENNKFVFFEKTFHKGIELKHWICNFCGLVLTSPYFNQEELIGFYQNDYRKIYHGQNHPTDVTYLTEIKRSEFQAEFIFNQNENYRNHLDIGASTGQLLNQIKAKYKDIESYGIEPNKYFGKLSNFSEIKIFNNINEITENSKFELITMSHVLEHIIEPVEFLLKIRNLLSSNGKFFIEVPNFYYHNSFEIAHIWHFTPKTLKEILVKSGFEIKKILLHGNPSRNPEKKYYIACFSEKKEIPQNLDFIKKINANVVKINRKLKINEGKIVKKLLNKLVKINYGYQQK